MTDLHEQFPARRSIRKVVPRQSTIHDGRSRELAALALELIEARLAAGEEAPAAVNEAVGAALGGFRAGVARAGAAILACLNGDGTRPVTAPNE